MRLATVSLTALILGVSASPVNQVPVINQAPFSNPRTPEAQTPEAFDGAPLPPKIDTVIGAVIRGHGYDQPKGCHNLDNSTAYEMPIGVCYHFPGQNAEVLVQHCGVLAIYQGRECDGIRSALPLGECFDTVQWYSARVEKCALS